MKKLTITTEHSVQQEHLCYRQPAARCKIQLPRSRYWRQRSINVQRYIKPYRCLTI